MDFRDTTSFRQYLPISCRISRRRWREIQSVVAVGESAHRKESLIPEGSQAFVVNHSPCELKHGDWFDVIFDESSPEDYVFLGTVFLSAIYNDSVLRDCAHFGWSQVVVVSFRSPPPFVSDLPFEFGGKRVGLTTESRIHGVVNGLRLVGQIRRFLSGVSAHSAGLSESDQGKIWRLLRGILLGTDSVEVFGWGRWSREFRKLHEVLATLRGSEGLSSQNEVSAAFNSALIDASPDLRFIETAFYRDCDRHGDVWWSESPTGN